MTHCPACNRLVDLDLNVEHFVECAMAPEVERIEDEEPHE